MCASTARFAARLCAWVLLGAAVAWRGGAERQGRIQGFQGFGANGAACRRALLGGKGHLNFPRLVTASTRDWIAFPAPHPRGTPQSTSERGSCWGRCSQEPGSVTEPRRRHQPCHQRGRVSRRRGPQPEEHSSTEADTGSACQEAGERGVGSTWQSTSRPRRSLDMLSHTM